MLAVIVMEAHDGANLVVLPTFQQHYQAKIAGPDAQIIFFLFFSVMFEAIKTIVQIFCVNQIFNNCFYKVTTIN